MTSFTIPKIQSVVLRHTRQIELAREKEKRNSHWKRTGYYLPNKVLEFKSCNYGGKKSWWDLCFHWMIDNPAVKRRV